MSRCIALIAWLAVAACSSSSVAANPTPSPSPSSNRSPTGAALPVTGGCGTTQVYQGGEPDWLTAAGDNNNPNYLPYFITDPPTAAGFLFSYPLRSGPYGKPGNKILWVVGVPRGGADLKVAGHPAGAAQPTVQYTFPANSGPGEIYPSETDAPTAGCWHFDLSWGTNKTSVDLVYGSA